MRNLIHVYVPINCVSFESDASGLDILCRRTKNKFAARPRGLQQIWNYVWKALVEAHQLVRGTLLYQTSNESFAKKTTMNHAPVRGESVCECWECLFVGQALVRVTSRSFPTSAPPLVPKTFLRARLFCLSNKEQFPTLSLQLAAGFMKSGCKPGKFRARRV